jgi:hypothetical protein
LRIAIICNLPFERLRRTPLKRVIGIVVAVSIAIALGIYLYPETQDAKPPSSQRVSAPEKSASSERATSSSNANAPALSLSSYQKSAAATILRVQTATDVFALFNELKNGQFGSDKENAAARYAAVLAVEECSTYTRPEMFRPVLEKIQSLPANDPNKATRLKAYEFDIGRCKGFEGWTPAQTSAARIELLEQAAKLGSSAAQLRQANYRYLDNFKKPEERQAAIDTLAKIQPDQDGTVMNEASRFIGNFKDYHYTSQRSGQEYDGAMVELALYSLGCEHGGLCAALTRSTNSQACWMKNDCSVLPPDQYIARERLAPAQYERFLILRQELHASFSAGQWPPGFWDKAFFPPVRIGAAVNK